MVKKAKVAPLSGMTIRRRKAPQSVGFVLPDAKDEELLPGRPRTKPGLRRVRQGHGLQNP